MMLLFILIALFTMMVGGWFGWNDDLTICMVLTCIAIGACLIVQRTAK